MWKKYGRAEKHTDDNITQRIRSYCKCAEELRLQTHAENIKFLWLFYGNNC